MQILDKNYHISQPKIIIFDWDNTLVDSWALIHKSINLTLVKYGRDTWSLEDTKILIHRSMRDTISKYFPDNWQEVGNYYRECYAEMSHDIKPLQNAKFSLDIAYNKNIECAIISNKSSKFLLQEIKILKWEKYFKSIIGAGDLEKDKPSPITVDATLRNMNRTMIQDKAWFIGDTITDMETAYNANCIPVFFGCEVKDFKNYKKCMPKIWFKDHNLLSNYLNSL